MFLLILAGTLKTGQSNPDFTFHNVSINTDIDWGNKEVIIYFTFHNVSINTLSRRTGSEKKRTFTFHNVSINTKPGKLSRA